RTRKDVIYFRAPDDTTSRSNIQWKNFPKTDTIGLQTYDPIIRQHDILDIFVSSINPEAASFFNPTSGGSGVQSLIRTNPEVIGYIVDVNGEIELPLIGSVKVAGLTVPMIKDTLKGKLEKYLENPTVRVVFENFKVSILGEVSRPGIYSVANERLTFPEAIAMAGDLTIFGRREKIMLIREENNKKEFATIDLTKRDLFDSPYFFLHPNDVIYVEPVISKIEGSDSFFRWYSFALTTITFGLVLGFRFIK
ncbi:MAG: polysaccharide biosynthesis/export family protein, partial [Bacteroidota bacterium]